MKRDPRAAEVMGALAWGPATLEPHHPDMFWYGIHTVEILYTFMGPGCEQVSRTHVDGADAIVGRWKDGRIGIVRGGRDTAPTYGQVVFGKKDVVTVPPAAAGEGAASKKSLYHGLVVAAVEFFKTGKTPVPMAETLEIMAFMEAADVSKARNGAAVPLTEVMPAR
jgi:hypothetical protein